ncbi:hypothetical protein [Acidimangrovimonas sediminis]|uniref:hypothetical protein n=1 Tax=Acidimangrovimonas sediminis TaxID=2056283 RepID=UPI000C8044BD|nr:hypothetical protein [Acidimangrovimonas sediminis]
MGQRKAAAIEAIEAETWTPELVRDRMLEALRWARYAGGRVGPRGFGSAIPAFVATLDDHLSEGWGLPEIAGDDRPSERVVRIRPTPAQVDAHLAALHWTADHLVGDHAGLARVLNLWLCCRVYKISFEKQLQRRGSTMARGHAYRLRDRALSVIAQRLDAGGVPVV